ncbi:uncharacterized protein LOC108253714 [Diaphorina citri]|uniref:RNA-directed DNA polymerase n=1 Tax=Diaphorina citri TaxID=121845 RepID=A0A1S4ENN2_DIACI|nr:uncharacterized protein LOC108253714 [Diaphorina citri]KAI5754061.1 hypothetical protein M8J77_005411 [Diaphorina citri]
MTSLERTVTPYPVLTTLWILFLLSPKKCNLFCTEVQYLGHVVSTEGVSTDPKKIEAVKSWPIPKDKHEVRSFLGLVSYYRRFIKGFADIARSLHRLTEKGKPFLWTQECNLSFETLVGTLQSTDFALRCSWRTFCVGH